MAPRRGKAREVGQPLGRCRSFRRCGIRTWWARHGAASRQGARGWAAAAALRGRRARASRLGLLG
eukprot:11206794-Lingulodinium_polyedra.AAC.1